MTNGTLIGNRYEIVETIGKGGMAIVYKAKCQILNRYVALKVLRPEYREDKDFISRFKVEAQSAGSLSHPNVVSIYDVVQDDELDYIVMEYVEGVTLKQYIEAKGNIPWREAVDYAAQICAGLDHAHKKGIVHKDIKPHNVIITREGTLKITDFGIAKVMSSSTITTGNTTMGSVHYFSPEQARGGYTDVKTDIYSLGVVLYEMVTGKLPFEGDTAIAVAMQHIEKEAILPSVLAPDIPKSLENVIRRAMSKEKAMRYDSVMQMLVDLKKVYTGNEVTFASNVTGNTIVTPIIKTEENDTENLSSSDSSNRKKDILSVLAGTAAGIVLVVLLFFLGYFLIGGGAADIPLPNFVGLTAEEAKEQVKDTKLVLTFEEEESDTVAVGTIIRQEPKAEKKVKENATIKLFISADKEGDNTSGELKTFSMPDLLNKNRADAEEILRKDDIVFSVVEEESETVWEDCVLRQTPTAGTEIDAATTVTIYVGVAKEKEMAEVPNLLGLSLEEAKEDLLGAGLNWGNIIEAESNKPAGTVLSQSIRPGVELKSETSIDLKVSKGAKATPEPTAEPAVSTPAPTTKPSIVIGPPNAGGAE
ncbi:MAG: Stk1 family PASTA domain-containing Ser/Thr kinase [Clostridia bacterium]|nr:Stk1 family PASTA domain-containing Ser/Thr kinase [Clostridia bacterium]